MQAYSVEPLYVPSGQDMLAADFYLPKSAKKPAVIVMAHGFAGLRHFKLVQYAQKFAQAGYAVVLFDYRYWGGSTGKPRELVSIKHQLEDWNTMLSFIATHKQIDERRIVVWGTGLSGGYVLQLASENKSIQAVMAQVPFVDGAELAKLYPLTQLPKALKMSSQDYMGGKVGLTPTCLPVVDPKKLSFLPTVDSNFGMQSILNPDYYWSGQVPARALFQLIRFRPIQSVRKISVPVLYIAAQQDSLIPIESSREAATNIAPFVTYHEWKMQHFEVYHPHWYDKAVNTQLEFLHQHIGVN